MWLQASIYVVTLHQQRLAAFLTALTEVLLIRTQHEVTCLVSSLISGSDFQVWQRWWQRQPVLPVPSEMLRCPKLLKPISWENYGLRLSAESVIVWWFSTGLSVRRYSTYTLSLAVEMIMVLCVYIQDRSAGHESFSATVSCFMMFIL